MTASVPAKLTLVTHGLTAATRIARFPVDEPLIDKPAGIRFPRADYFVTAPELRARETAGDPTVKIDAGLRDLDCGSWAGMGLEDVDSALLHRWLTDPDAAPHGGESVSELCRRISAWLEDCATRGGRTVAVTHQAVVRAAIVNALNVPYSSFWRVDVAPLTRTILRYRNGGWTVKIGASVSGT
ncbi:histidine phosphatase family protein [Smaragdicoccus niigatensis]|uniref:histidine phosphatase family protein n=1 Tax=Smaragdicoccus niigatensis TaxID=359359 RepID=UPI00037A5379|nr:histidine phosphatase family protein [Smaragdicoccus niigatensis]